MIFGVLYGSYFGFALFPALWFNLDAVVAGHVTAGPVRDVYGVLGITIKFGIIVIYTGLILNWVNLFRKKAWLKMTLDKNGIVGGILFGTGLYMGFGFVGSNYKEFPSDPWISIVLTVTIILLFLRGFVDYYLSVKEGGHKESAGKVIMDSTMEFLVDMLEIFGGYLSNTLSFMRVAGLEIGRASCRERV